LAVMMLAASVITASANDDRQYNLANFIKTNTYNNNFTDIDNWAREYIINAYEYGIVIGVGGNAFNPSGHFTAAQAITVAARMHAIYKYAGGATDKLNEYSADGASGHWAAGYIAYAKAERLIDDAWDSVLNEPVTRAGTMRIWSGVLQPKDMTKLNNVYDLPDVSISTPYFAEIVLFYEAGIVQGSTIAGVENSFNPGGLLTRAEASTTFMRLVDAKMRAEGRTYGKKTVSDLAGTGSRGFTNGAAATAAFTLPYSVTADRNGRIVIFDTFNNALRLFGGGTVSTITGQFVAEDENRFSRGFYRDGPLAGATGALFDRPADGVYNAAGDLFITDSENHVIRRISGGNVTTFAGTTQGHADGAGSAAKFDTPMAVAIDGSGNLYVADTLNNCIRKIDTRGNVTTVAGRAGHAGDNDGDAAAALFREPSGIAVSSDGNVIYVADTGNHKIRKVENGRVTTLAGATEETDEDGDPMGGFRDGAGSQAVFNLPASLALADGVLFVADSGNNVIRAVNMQGHVFTAAGTGEPGDREGGSLTAEFNQPRGVHWHSGALIIADTTNNKLKTLTVDITMFKED